MAILKHTLKKLEIKKKTFEIFCHSCIAFFVALLKDAYKCMFLTYNFIKISSNRFKFILFFLRNARKKICVFFSTWLLGGFIHIFPRSHSDPKSTVMVKKKITFFPHSYCMY